MSKKIIKKYMMYCWLKLIYTRDNIIKIYSIKCKQLKTKLDKYILFINLKKKGSAR